MRNPWTVRGALGVGAGAVLAFSALLLPSCQMESGGHFSLLGYTTRPNYDLRYKTVRVPVFKNRTYWTVTPVPGMDMDLTQAVIREIQARTPYRVKQCDADTEIQGTITNFTKMTLNANQMNYARDVQTALTVEILWIDLQTGEPISRAARRPGQPRDPEARAPVLAMPDNPFGLNPRSAPPVIGPPTSPSDATAASGDLYVEPDPEDEKKRKRPAPIILRSVTNFRPEIGESLTTAMQANINQMAVQIVSAMEKPW